MVDELVEALGRIRDDDAVRAVVLHGAGGAFCAGGDLRDTDAAGPRTAEQGQRVMARYHRLVRALQGLDRPVIAAVDGVAYGAGFSLLLLADIVLLGEDARLCMAFQRVGLVPDCGALYTLPRAVGLQRAKELMLSAREIGAQEAQSMGLALEVLPGVDLLPRALQMAQAFCGASPAAVPMIKRALDASLQADLDTVLALEASSQGVALSTAYVGEAARRFASKAEPQFRWPAKRIRAVDL
jgi:2-(1,2-epoxy-1,2-dihydrophenyl)acetyl-CoA isomerase